MGGGHTRIYNIIRCLNLKGVRLSKVGLANALTHPPNVPESHLRQMGEYVRTQTLVIHHWAEPSVIVQLIFLGKVKYRQVFVQICTNSSRAETSSTPSQT